MTMIFWIQNSFFKKNVLFMEIFSKRLILIRGKKGMVSKKKRYFDFGMRNVDFGIL